MRLVRLGSVLALVLGFGTAASADPVLERVVMLSRHGVRSPIRRIEALEALTHRSWPKWPVGPGEMTEHGAHNLSLMADFLREAYRSKGALPAKGCPAPEAIAIWSDAADHRTRQSGDIFADHLAPGCHVPAHFITDGVADPLFDATQTNACPIGIVGRAKTLATSFWRSASPLTTQEDRALQELQLILAPHACKHEEAGLCLVPKTGASAKETDTKLSVAAALAEGIYLEYVQGFPVGNVGWGKAGDEATIASIMPAYERGINLMRRNPVHAARRGALLMRTILAQLQGKRPPAGAPDLPADAKLVMIAGHDSNLLQAAVLMGLDWRLPGQPSVTAPDTTLAFEVWHNPETGRRTLRVVVYAQTLAQLREGTLLDTAHPPDVVTVVPESCAGAGGCELDAFVSNIERSLAALCKG